MRAIFKLLVDNMKMTVRNKQALVWTFLMPIVLIVLFGLAFGKSETLVIKTGVIDNAKNEYSKSFIKSLKNIDAIKVTQKSKSKELKYLKEGDRSLVIIIPDDFGKAVDDLAAAKKAQEEAIKASQAPQAQGSAIANQTQAQQNTAPQAQSPPKIKASKLKVYYDETNQTVSGTAKSIIKQIVLSMNQKMSSSPEIFDLSFKKVSAIKLSAIDFFTTGILGMFLMNGGAIGVVMIIVGYREQGILKRLKATPLSITTFLGTNIIVRVIIAIIQMLTILGIAIFIFDAHVAGSYWLLGLIVIEGSLVFIALGFAIASFAESNQTAQAIGNIVTMPMLFLSGVFFPIESFPDFIQPIIKFLPLTYLVEALRQVMMRGAKFGAVAYEMGILAIFGVVIFVFSLFMFRWE